MKDPVVRSLIHIIRRLYEPAFWLSKKMSRRGLYPFLNNEFSSIRKSDRVLSVGAGGRVNDLLLAHAERTGFEVVQLDIDPGRRPAIVADICHWSAPSQYDVVVASEVLEHVQSPRLATSNLHASLRDNGRLILTTPFLFPIHDQPFDYYRFTRFGLALILGDFQSVEIGERNSWSEAILVLAARTLKGESRTLKLIAPLLLLLTALLYPIGWLLGRLFPSGFMTTGYNVTARKKEGANRSPEVPHHSRTQAPPRSHT